MHAPPPSEEISGPVTIPFSVIVPAYNEESVIARCLEALTSGALPGEVDVVVACNGCRDATARVASSFGGPVRVVETAEASKTAALNLGDDAALHFPRFYVDADVMIDVESLRRMARALADGDALAVSPRMRMDLDGASWAVRAFYRVWELLPYTREGMIGVGSYGLSEEGRRRFGEFPRVIADDGFVRLQFRAGERVSVPGAAGRVVAPKRLDDRIRIKTRSRLGGYELRSRYPELTAAEQRGKSYGAALRTVALRPHLWPHALVYLAVNLASRRRAAAQLARRDDYVWERDDSSRT